MKFFDHSAHLLIAMLLGVAACSDQVATDLNVPMPPAPAALSALGSGQSGTAGEPLANPIGVRAVDTDGNPVQGLAVSFVVTAGGGSLGAAKVVTDAEGVASTTWVVSTRAGVVNSVAAALADYPALRSTFSASSTPGPAAALEMFSGNGQSTFTGLTLPGRPVVRVVDAYANPVAGVEVHWTVMAGGGTVSSPTSSTAGDGLASVVWTLGGTTGANSQALNATVDGLPASSVASFVASAAPAPAGLIKVSGDLQAATWGQALPQPMVIRVLDAEGTPVPGLKVYWFDRQDWMGGFRELSQTTTNSLGEASATLTLLAQDFWGPADSVRVASANVYFGEGGHLYTEFYVVNH